MHVALTELVKIDPLIYGALLTCCRGNQAITYSLQRFNWTFLKFMSWNSKKFGSEFRRIDVSAHWLLLHVTRGCDTWVGQSRI